MDRSRVSRTTNGIVVWYIRYNRQPQYRPFCSSFCETRHQLAIIDHELRFNPTWRRLKVLIDSGFVGDIHHVSLTIAAGFRHSALRPCGSWKAVPSLDFR